MRLDSVRVPAALARTITDLHGDAGQTWLGDLPALVNHCARRWALATIEPPLAPLSYHYVCSAVRADGTKVVLKAGVPGRELCAEIAALQCFDGHGMARLLDADVARGALLLERIAPGTSLADNWSAEHDEAATSAAAQAMRALWRPAPPAPHPFPTVADWGKGFARLRSRFGGATGPLPAVLVARAESRFADLLISSPTPVLLHGDLHHGNILAASPTKAPTCATARHYNWRAIDPKGVIGEPAYEVGALLRNPLPGLLAVPNAGRLLARRVDQLADELSLDRARIRGWGMAQAVLSAWWSLEDHGEGWENAIAVAAHLAAAPS